MKLKKAKFLAHKQITNIISNLELLNEAHSNKKLKEVLENIKTESIELIDYFIDNCQEEGEKIKEMNERNYSKRPSFKEILENEI